MWPRLRCGVRWVLVEPATHTVCLVGGVARQARAAQVSYTSQVESRRTGQSQMSVCLFGLHGCELCACMLVGQWPVLAGGWFLLRHALFVWIKEHTVRQRPLLFWHYSGTIRGP